MGILAPEVLPLLMVRVDGHACVIVYSLAVLPAYRPQLTIVIRPSVALLVTPTAGLRLHRLHLHHLLRYLGMAVHPQCHPLSMAASTRSTRATSTASAVHSTRSFRRRRHRRLVLPLPPTPHHLVRLLHHLRRLLHHLPPRFQL